MQKAQTRMRESRKKRSWDGGTFPGPGEEKARALGHPEKETDHRWNNRGGKSAHGRRHRPDQLHAALPSLPFSFGAGTGSVVLSDSAGSRRLGLRVSIMSTTCLRTGLSWKRGFE